MVPAIQKTKSEDLSILSFYVEGRSLVAEVSDGRMIAIPVDWFDKLAQAPLDSLQKFEISPGGYGIHWPDLDEDISIKAFIDP